ncbi:MAG: hypothetical protein ACRD1B_04200, partial [Thermoanaerobaculia bacterium]
MPRPRSASGKLRAARWVAVWTFGPLVALQVLVASADAAPLYHKTITINPGQVTGGPLTNFPFLFNSTEVGVAYKDSVFMPAARVQILGSTTDANHTITLTADPPNRHNGIPGAGVVYQGTGTGDTGLWI